MSAPADDGAALGSRRLTVREPGDGPDGASTGGFRENLDLGEVPFDSDRSYATVKEGDTRAVDTVEDAISAFDAYIEEKDDASLVLADRDGDQTLVLPYEHRWSESYRSRTYARLKDAERALERKYEDPVPTTQLTLTAHQTDERGEPRPVAEVLRDLRDGWDKFRRVVRRATERIDTEYIAVVEPHQSGYPHLHVFLFGAALPSLSEKVREMWVERYGVGGEEAHDNRAVEVQSGRTSQVESPAAYAMQYLGKSLVRETGEQQQVDGFRAFCALLFVTETRQFSTSAWISEAMKQPEEKIEETDWEFVGVGCGLEPGCYEGEVARQLARHVDDGRGWEPPPGEAVKGGGKQRSLSV